MFKDIVIAVDGSDHARNAMKIGCDLALKYDSSIHIVTAPYLETVAYAMGSGAVEIQPTQSEIQKAGKQVMDEAVTLAKNAGVEPAPTAIRGGDAKSVILKAVEDTGADLVIMGRRGLGSVGSLILGSTSLRVSHDAPCAVMTVK